MNGAAGVPTEMLPNHIELKRKLVREIVAPLRRLFDCHVFDAKGWGLPVLLS